MLALKVNFLKVFQIYFGSTLVSQERISVKETFTFHLIQKEEINTRHYKHRKSFLS